MVGDPYDISRKRIIDTAHQDYRLNGSAKLLDCVERLVINTPIRKLGQICSFRVKLIKS